MVYNRETTILIIKKIINNTFEKINEIYNDKYTEKELYEK